MKKLVSLVIILAILFSITVQAFGASTVKPYKDQKLGWWINLPVDFNKTTITVKPNETQFIKQGSPNKIDVNMYSISGLTLDSWVSRETKFIKDNYIPALYVITKTENSKIKTMKCKKVYLKIQTEDGWMNQVRIYMAGKNFRYMVSYIMTAADYQNSAAKASMDTAIASFSFIEPNIKSEGVLTESLTAFDSKTKLKISNTGLGCSFEIPNTWKKVKDDKSSTLCAVNSSDMAVSIKSVDNPDNIFLDEYSEKYEAALKSTVDNKVVFKSRISANHYPGMYYVLSRTGFEDKVYLLQNGFNLYIMTFSTRNYANTANNITIIDSILNSINLSEKEAESISDFSEVLKGTAKDHVGDSYYKWSATIPKSFAMTTRTFDGRFTAFETSDKKCLINVEIMENDQKQNLDSILSSVVKNNKDKYTITVSEKRTTGTQQYAVISYKGVKDDFVDELRYYIVGGNILSIALRQPETVYNSRTYNNVLDSFLLSFPNDNSANDLSNISKDGLRLYASLKFGWFIGVLPDWYLESTENKGNSAIFYIDDNNSLHVNMYSNELGLTLDKLVENEISRMNRVYNKELTTISQPEDITVNGLKCRRINLSFKINNKMYYESHTYYVGKSYRYQFGYSLDSDKYNDTAIKSGVDKMLNSFLCLEPNAATVGKLYDTESESKDSSGRTISSTQYKWSVILPSDFTESEYYKSEDAADYFNDITRLDFSIDVYTAKKSIEQYASDFENFMKENSNYSVISTEILNEKGTTVKKFVYKYADSKDTYAYHYINYTLCKNGNLYDIYFSVPDYRYTDYSTQVFKAIWDSMNF